MTTAWIRPHSDQGDSAISEYHCLVLESWCGSSNSSRESHCIHNSFHVGITAVGYIYNAIL